MALFPAYVTTKIAGMMEKVEIPSHVESCSNDEMAVDSAEETRLLSPIRKRHKHKSKDVQPILNSDNFYVDSKIDYGNMRVSTLYKPARPNYRYLRPVVGFKCFSKRNLFCRTKRYFQIPNVNVDSTKNGSSDSSKVSKKAGSSRSKKVSKNTSSHSSNDSKNASSHSSKVSKKSTKEFIVIDDSEVQWDSNRVENELMDKTAQFNRHLDDNPYDVNMWLCYVKFQDERLAFDISCKNISSATTALNNCREKQLAILDRALKHNSNSMKLLYKKVEISEACLAKDKYLAMLKTLIGSHELSSAMVIRGWFWYLDAVQTSMALCSVPSVKEMYIGAIKALNKLQRQTYQASHVDLTYRIGLFLRQAGLWEQLWMLLKLNLETNLAVSRLGGTFNFETFPIDKSAMIKVESEIIGTCLPLHEIWSRVELVRSKVQWLPATEETDDPQRMVFSTDFADFIKPVSNQSYMFALTVNMLRLLKIPLLPHSNGGYMTLNVNGFIVDWEYDNIECTLPFFYTMINSLERFDHKKFKIMTQILNDFVQEPNYIDMSGDFFKFSNNIMLQCSQWFDGEERTAILVWWFRFIQTLVAINISIHPDNDTSKKIINNVKKQVKDVLKSNRENTLIYKEYSTFEAQISGIDKGISVMEACLQALPKDKTLSKVHLTRAYVELNLRADTLSDASVERCKSVLVNLALNNPSILSPFDSSNSQVILEASQEFSDYTDTLITQTNSLEKNIDIVEQIMPNLAIDWICCYGWFVYLTQPIEALGALMKKVFDITQVEKSEDYDNESKRKLSIREGFFEWILHASQVFIRINEIAIKTIGKDMWQNAIEEFPSNSFIAWCVTGAFIQRPSSRWSLMRVIKNDAPATMVVLALVLQNFTNLYKKYDPSYEDIWQVGCDNRLLNHLQTIVTHPVFKKCALFWHMLIEFVSCHTQESTALSKKYIYQALDECPWNKALYFTGCVRAPSEFSELIDIMVDKQIRLHAMPEELQL